MNEHANCAAPLAAPRLDYDPTQVVLTIMATALSLAVLENTGSYSPTAILGLFMVAILAVLAGLGVSLESGFARSLLVPVSLGCLAVQFVALCYASTVDSRSESFGVVKFFAVLVLLAVATGLSVLWKKGFARSLLVPVSLGCLAVQFVALCCALIVDTPESFGKTKFCAMLALLAVAATVAGALCLKRLWFGKMTVPVLVGIQAAMGFMTIAWMPAPEIDVLLFQQESCEALLQGNNPYSIRFLDPYPPQDSPNFYGPGVSVDGVLQFGYPYMPATLLMALPGYLLGDVRYANLACVVIAAMLVAYARPAPGAKTASMLLLYSPITLFVVSTAWTESYVVLLLALTWFCHCRKSKLLPYVFGLLVVSKQYMLGVVPLGLLLLPRPWTFRCIAGFAARAAAVGMAVTLPLALWNPGAFWDSVIALQMRQPYRPDALSFLVWAAPEEPLEWVWLSFACFALAMAACLWLALRRRPVSFPMALGLCLLALFCLNKQAFANYYFLVVAASCIAVGASGFEGGEQTDAATPGKRREKG